MREYILNMLEEKEFFRVIAAYFVRNSRKFRCQNESHKLAYLRHVVFLSEFFSRCLIAFTVSREWFEHLYRRLSGAFSLFLFKVEIFSEDWPCVRC